MTTVIYNAHLGTAQEPEYLRTTVDNARALLVTIAGAVITVTGLTLGLIVITLQPASSQFSPRVLRSYYRSHFQQSVIGFTLGTFTYCLLVLRVVRAPLEQGGEAVVPSLSVAMAVVLGVAATLVILAYVNYIGHAMRVSNLIEHVSDETLVGIHRLPLHQIGDSSLDNTLELHPRGNGYVVRAHRGGWVKQAPSQALLAAIPAGSIVRLEVRVDGPLAFDNAVSASAARTKGIVSPVAGQSDILVVPDLESGNMLAKQLEYLAEAQSAGIVVWAHMASCVIAQLVAHSKRKVKP